MLVKKIFIMTFILLFSLSIYAQGQTEQAESASATTSKVKRIKEVHKGFFINTDIGLGLTLSSDIDALSSGFSNSLTIGYDIIEILSVEAGFYSFFISANNDTNYSYGYGYNKNGELVYFDSKKCKEEFNKNNKDKAIDIDVDKCAEKFPKYLSNDLSSQVIGLSVKFAYLSTERLFAYIRAGGGFAFLSPDRNFKSNGNELKMDSSTVVVDGGFGAEYYTVLRHFSVALEARTYYLLGIGTLYLTLQPSIKYTF